MIFLSAFMCLVFLDLCKERLMFSGGERGVFFFKKALLLTRGILAMWDCEVVEFHGDFE